MIGNDPDDIRDRRAVAFAGWALWFQIFLYAQPVWFPSREIFEITRTGGLAIMIGLALGWAARTHGDVWTFTQIAKSQESDR